MTFASINSYSLLIVSKVAVKFRDWVVTVMQHKTLIKCFTANILVMHANMQLIGH